VTVPWISITAIPLEFVNETQLSFTHHVSYRALRVTHFPNAAANLPRLRLRFRADSECTGPQALASRGVSNGWLNRHEFDDAAT
jgi:hypothetical protein